jgi:exodeoxyribonuclease VII large subunit
VFDSRAVAEAIAHSPIPVLTGLGHEIDQAIADLTSHAAFKTPTKVAEFLVDRVQVAERRTVESCRALGRASVEMLRRGRETLGRAEGGLAQARWRLAREVAGLRHLAQQISRAASRYLEASRRKLGEMPRRVRAAAPLPIERNRYRPLRLAERIAGRSELRLRELQERLSGWERLCVQLDPERTLDRGFSITRNSAGRVLTDPAQIASGERIISQLAGGRLRSQVEKS